MRIEIKRLTPELLDDWLDFFDHATFTDNNEWSGCYRMAPHWNQKLQNEAPWEYSKAGALRNRNCARKHVIQGKMQGYLAYYDNQVVGWCNVNDKQNYNSIFFNLPWEEGERMKKIKSIACFFVEPKHRLLGIASKLLKQLTLDAKQEGYEYIEAYPFTHNDNQAFTGPISLYEKAGFEVHNENNIVTVFRKYL